MSAREERVEALAGVLAAHTPTNGFDEIGVWFNYGCSCSAVGDSDEWHRRHIAEAIASDRLLDSDALRALIAEERAGALRDAQEAAEAVGWLRAAAFLAEYRADREEGR